MKTMRRGLRATVLVVFGFVILSGSAWAGPMMIDYTGFTWNQTVGLDTQFHTVGVIDNFSPYLGDPNEVYTYYISGLTQTSVINLGAGLYRYGYSGGNFRLYQSTSAANRAYDYGINPPNPTAPATFTDGLYWLGGDFSAFSMVVDANRGIGTVSGQGLYNGGSFYTNLSGYSLFTFAGVTRDQAAHIPTGYQYRIDGELTAEVNPVPEPASLVLMGLGLAGVGLARSRKRS